MPRYYHIEVIEATDANDARRKLHTRTFDDEHFNHDLIISDELVSIDYTNAF